LKTLTDRNLKVYFILKIDKDKGIVSNNATTTDKVTSSNQHNKEPKKVELKNSTNYKPFNINQGQGQHLQDDLQAYSNEWIKKILYKNYNTKLVEDNKNIRRLKLIKLPEPK
jgi:hypothetical protein